MEKIYNCDKRDDFIDYLKGVTIFFVLWGHSIQYMTCDLSFFSDVVFKKIYSFHMPLFMFLSGYVFFWTCNRKELTDIIISRIRGLGMPMGIWGLVSFVISLRIVIPKSIIQGMRVYFSNCLSIWFLWAVLASSIIVGAIYKSRFKHRFIKYLFMFLFMSLIAVLPGNKYNLFVYPFFIVGFIFNEYKVFEHKVFIRIIVPFIIAGWIIMLLFYREEHFIYISGISPFGSEFGFWGQIKIDIYRYLIGFLGTLSVIYIFEIVYRLLRYNKVAKIIIYGGRHSLDIYVMQRLVLEYVLAAVFVKFVDYCGINYFTKNMLLFDYVYSFLCSLLCFAILLFGAKQIEKSRIISFLLFGRVKKRM